KQVKKKGSPKIKKRKNGGRSRGHCVLRRRGLRARRTAPQQLAALVSPLPRGSVEIAPKNGRMPVFQRRRCQIAARIPPALRFRHGALLLDKILRADDRDAVRTV